LTITQLYIFNEKCITKHISIQEILKSKFLILKFQKKKKIYLIYLINTIIKGREELIYEYTLIYTIFFLFLILKY